VVVMQEHVSFPTYGFHKQLIRYVHIKQFQFNQKAETETNTNRNLTMCIYGTVC
jgi:hypothetical protein